MEVPARANPRAVNLVGFLSSMQLGIGLLLGLAVVSVFGTALELDRAITYIYRSWWYQGLLAFTGLNLFLCSIRRAAPLARLAWHPRRDATPDEARQLPVSATFRLAEGRDPVVAAAGALKRAGLGVSLETGAAGGTVVFGERGRLGYFGSMISHWSMLVILLGAAYGGLTGFEAVNGGWAGHQFRVPEGDFQVAINAIRMVQREDPVLRPRVYTSVTVTRGGRTLIQDQVSINYPLRFEGNSIYHSTFLYMPVIKLTRLETGETRIERVLADQRVVLDGQGTVYLQLMRFFPHFARRPDGSLYNVDYRPENPVAGGFLVRDGRQEGAVFLGVGSPQLFDTAGGQVEARLAGFELATVFTINRNLGRPYLLAGSLLLLVGLFLSFCVLPVRFWAVFDPQAHALVVGGRGYRYGLAAEQVLERIQAELARPGERGGR
jgi:cytochrome c biogenesis protein